MKKNLLIITCLFMLFGCSKNNNESTNTNQKKSNDLSISAKGGADSLSSNDTTKKQRGLTINNISCAYSKAYARPYASNYYTIIGRFPGFGGNGTVIPKAIWTAGDYTFNNQNDGNLVVYKKSTGKSLWGSSNTFNKTTSVILQGDLNLVAYDPAHVGVFESQTYYFVCNNKIPRNTMLVLTIDGDLEIIADGMASFGPVTVVLASTRTFGGVHSPNDGKFFKDYTTSGGAGGVNFVY